MGIQGFKKISQGRNPEPHSNTTLRGASNTEVWEEERE